MVKYCMNPETGAVKEQQRQEVLLGTQRRNPSSEKLRQPRTGFKEDRGQKEAPVQFRSNRERLLNTKISR